MKSPIQKIVANGLPNFSTDAVKRREKDKLIDEWIEENPGYLLELKNLSRDELIHRLTRVEIGAAYDRVMARRPKRPGRPKRIPVLQKTKRSTQPISSRHLNFGKKEIKWTMERKFLLICVVEAAKLKYSLTKDSDALHIVAEKIKRGSRQGVILNTAKRLAPALTRARKSICGKDDYDEHIQLLAKKLSTEDYI